MWITFLLCVLSNGLSTLLKELQNSTNKDWTALHYFKNYIDGGKVSVNRICVFIQIPCLFQDCLTFKINCRNQLQGNMCYGIGLRNIHLYRIYVNIICVYMIIIHLPPLTIEYFYLSNQIEIFTKCNRIMISQSDR